MSRDALTQQAYRFALAPTPEQEEFLCACCGASRFWFNQGLALVKDRLEQRACGLDVDVPWSYKGLCVAFRGDTIKDQLAPWRSEVVTGSVKAGPRGGSLRGGWRVASSASPSCTSVWPRR